MRLKDKIVLVAGAGGRQGTTVPLLFAREGAKLVLGGLDGDEVDRLAVLIRERGGDAVARRTDLTQESEAEAAVALCVERYGRIDVLYNNTGIYIAGDQRAHETDADTWRKIMDVDLRSHFFTSKHALAEMVKQQSGAIINVAAARPARLGGNAAYGAAKSAIIGMTQKMAKEYAADNIRINCLCPTNIQESPNPQDPQLPQPLIARDGMPEDVAYAALFLASDEAAWITGTILTVDGGAEVMS